MDLYMEKYKQYLENKRTSPNTIYAYFKDLNEFYSFINENNLDIKNINDNDISNFMNFIFKKGYADTTNARKIISVRNFFKFLYKFDYIINNPTLKQDIPKTEKKLPVILEFSEVEKLLISIKTDSLKGKRDRALLELMYACGLKASEAVNLKIYNLNIKMGYIICTDSKSKERIIPFGDAAGKALTDYLNVRESVDKEKTDFLFLNLTGGRLSRQGLWKILKERAADADIEKAVDLNILRHSFAFHLLSNGADIKSIQELLGHKELTSTILYANIKKRNKLREVYKKSHPRA